KLRNASALYIWAKLLPPCRASIRPAWPTIPYTSRPAIVRSPVSAEYEATARVNVPQVKSPPVRASSTRSCGGLSEWMSATWVLISRRKKAVTSRQNSSVEMVPAFDGAVGCGTCCAHPQKILNVRRDSKTVRHLIFATIEWDFL